MTADELLACAVDGLLMVRVTPKAASERVRIERRADGGTLVRVDVTAAPERGKANAAVIGLLAKALGRPHSSLSVAQGEMARDKVIRLD
jgi:hypothetical protein